MDNNETPPKYPWIFLSILLIFDTTSAILAWIQLRSILQVLLLIVLWIGTCYWIIDFVNDCYLGDIEKWEKEQKKKKEDDKM